MINSKDSAAKKGKVKKRKVRSGMDGKNRYIIKPAKGVDIEALKRAAREYL